MFSYRIPLQHTSRKSGRVLASADLRIVPRTLLTCWFLAIVLAKVLPATGQVYHVHRYTESDGLPSSAVRDIVQSADGQMWFATRNGISTYDGQTWVTHGINDGLARMNQALLAIDSKERIWAVSAGPVVEVSIFENGNWKRIPLPLETENAISLLTLDGKSTDALIGHNQGLFHIQNGVYRNLEFEGKTPTSVFSLKQFGGSIYAATDHGLFTVNLSEEPELQLVNNSPEEPIKGLAPGPNREQLWVIGRDWIGTFDGNQWSRLEQQFEDFDAKLDAAVTAISGPNGELYFGTRTGLFSYREKEGINRIGLQNGLVSEGVNDLLIDREGLLWVSCPRGVSKIVSFAFANFGRREGLFDDEVAAVFHRSDGTTILGHVCGLTFFDQKPLKTVRLGSKLTTRLQDFAEDSSGNLWIAGGAGGLFLTDQQGETNPFPIPSSWVSVNSVIVDQSDQLWVATGREILRRQGNRFLANSPFSRSAKGDAFRKLFLDRQGKIVVATMSRGLWRLDADGWKNWSGEKQQSLASNVFAYLDRPTGGPLIGTAAGLRTLEGDKIVSLVEPRIDRPVYFIVEDQQDRIWIGTDNGVMIWDGNDLRHLTVKQGLAGRETNRAAGKLDSLGQLWVGTAEGLSIYRPDFDSRPVQPPDVKLIRATAGDQTWDPNEARSMPSNRNALTFDYRAISFLDENEIQIKSWLEGLESGWQTPVRPHQWKIHYNFLPPGEYRLHLQAANVDGQWSDVVSSNAIRIDPPFWRTGWFYALVLASVATVGFFSHRFFNQRRYLRRLELEVVARVADLQESEKRYGVTLNSIADGVMTTGMEGEILFMNPAAEQIVGKALQDVRGQSLIDVLPLRTSAANTLDDLTDNLVRGNIFASSLQFQTPDGTSRNIESSGAPLRNAEQKLIGAVVAIRDVTEKIHLQKELAQSQKLASLGTLAGGIAHDFNNLLAVISWNMSWLTPDSPRPVQHDAVGLITGALTQAQNLTQQIITFARGGTPLLQTCFVDGLIRDAIALMPNEPDVRFQLELVENLWPLDVDAVQINQVLVNVLINAKQAMPNGGLIRIRTKNRIDNSSRIEQRFVEIEIQDEGIGIPAEQMDRVFEPYFTTKENGSGIGLATSYSIIKRHTGKLSIESEIGRGSTIRILLPASNQTPTAAIKVQAQPGSSRRVLVVDDDALVRQSMKAVLTTIGFDVSTVEGGVEAIEVYQFELVNDRQFHAVLIDLKMQGGLGGCETIQQLLEIDPHVRGIAISGYSDEQVLSNYRQHGFVDRLQKPCSLEELQAALNLPSAIQTDTESPTIA